MEYVEGETLRSHIYEQKTPLTKLLKYLQQVAEGLTKAHANGIVHRDLKPDNIMITRDGYAKILDFGLAKLVEQPKRTTTGDSSEVATALMSPPSIPGLVMGTVGYMSPEQAQGKTAEIDHRSDVFSFGCILYEAVTGKKAFDGVDILDSLHKIVHAPTPQIRDANPHVSRDLERIVQRCLAKDPDKRYQSIKEVAIELEELKPEVTEAAFRTVSTQPVDSTNEVGRPTTSAEYLVGEIKRHKRGIAIAGVIAFLLLTVTGFALYSFLSKRSATSNVAFKITPLTSSPGIERNVAFSPDGNRIAYVHLGPETNSQFDVYVQLIGAGEPLRLTTDPGREMSPAFSPDGRYIAFLRGTQSDKTKGLYVVPAMGGAERKLSESFGIAATGVAPHRVDWSPDGRTVAVVDKVSADEPWAIFLVSVDSGERRRLTQTPAGFNGDILIAFAPDGSRIGFVRSKSLTGDIYTVAVTGGEPVRVTSDDATFYGLGWTSDGGSLVFSSERAGSSSTLWRVPATGGNPTPIPVVGENIRELAIARQGDRLSYTQQIIDSNIYRIELTGKDNRNRSASTPVNLISSTRQEGEGHFSPDGHRIVFRSNRMGNTELWICDSEGKNIAQLTNLGGPRAANPTWSPDGRFVAFSSSPAGSADIYVINANGGIPRRLTSDRSGEIAPSWSHDGRWIYFASNRTGRAEVWKIPAEGGDATQLTRGGGIRPVESPDSRSVYYAKRADEGELWQVPVDGGQESRALEATMDATNWVVTPTGIYYFTVNRSQPNARPYTLWFFDFATRATSQITTIEGPRVSFLITDMAVSPDERWLLFTQRDQLEYDLMLVEDFK
jgi:Tol biopolymer transport system component